MHLPEKDTNKDGQKPAGGWARSLGCGSWLVWSLLLLLVIPWAIQLFTGGSQPGTSISYSAFRQQVAAGNVKEVTVSGDQISGELKQAAPAPVQTAEAPGLLNPLLPSAASDQPTTYTSFITYLPSFGDTELLPLLQQNGVTVNTRPQGGFSALIILMNVVPFIALIGLGYLLFRRMRLQGDSVFSMGKSRAKLYEKKAESITFQDVAGAAGAKRELEEVVGFLKSPGRYERLGGEIPRGVLLVGPPGTGKTLLARAVAGEAGAPFFSITGSDFMEMFVGVGASRVRDLFTEAKKASPSIIFIDELDSIGRRRGAGIGGGNDEREQTLNQLLSEMDGFERNQNVIVMAATNRPDILDPALLRPGRFDRRVTVDLPTMRDRLEILRIHARNKPLAGEVDLEKIARGTPGFSGADLANLLNEAALLAARLGKDAIDNQDLNNARDKVLMGLERENLVLTEQEWRMLAYHEAGHAVLAAVLPDADPIHKVTIVPRGRAMGVTQQLPERDRYLYPRNYMLDRLAVMMGGRAAEELVFGDITSGAENDLKQATNLARKMVLDWGMGEHLRHIALSTGDDEIFLGDELTRRREFSEATAREVDEEVRRILESAFRRAKGTLQENRTGLDRVVDALLEKEEVPGEEVLQLLGVAQPIKVEELTKPLEASALPDRQ